MLRSVERASEMVTSRDEAFFFGSRTTLGLSHQTSEITEGSRKAEQLRE